MNQAKVFICSVAPPFTLVASTRAGLRLMQTDKVQKVVFPVIGGPRNLANR